MPKKTPPQPEVQQMPQMANQVPGQMPNQMPGMPQMQPGMQPGMGGNPMMQMMQMMQMMMMGGGGMPSMGVDPSALPFGGAGSAGMGPGAVDDGDPGLEAEIIRPATLTERIRTQQALTLGSVLDLLCLTEDGSKSLGGVPMGCTMAFAGPPGKGKTRSALAALVNVALAGHKVAFVVAEEGFHSDEDFGRDDLCSRLVKLGMAVSGLKEKAFADKVLANMYVLESQYHKSQTWDDFIHRYRYLVEKEEIDFVVIDSLNMLDPSKQRTADNLAALKTYNHDHGVTCICIGQIRDTGSPVGGEALQHTADAVFLIEELSLTSKEMAEQWGGKYRDKIEVIRAVKSVTTPIFPHPLRVAQDPGTGVLQPHETQPPEYALPPVAKG